MNRNVIITGGARGIGKAMVCEFAKQNDNVIFCYNKSKEEAELLEKNLCKEGYSVKAVKADLSRLEEIEHFAEYAINEFKNIDVLINNSGIDQFKLFVDITENDWNEIINTNLKSATFLSKYIVKNM